MQTPRCEPWIPEPREALQALAWGLGLSILFWWPLWWGGGLQGGDLYSYYIPQKALLADALQRGSLPLWNHLTGWGYPAVAESQTGVLYPPNWVLYRLFDINTAYVINQLLHYLVAFLATWGVARQLGMSQQAAALAAMSFVYGWLPARICLEWAAIGVAYLAVVFWCSMGWLQTGCPRSWGALAISLGLVLLAGHFHLAFITLLAVTALAAWHLLAALLPGDWSASSSSIRSSWRANGIEAGWLLAAVAGGMLVATVQLWPTWELKQQSQRQAAGRDFDPGYGLMPPQALVQLAGPWIMRLGTDSADTVLEQMQWLRYPAATNKVEAHLYVGLLPLLLAIWAVVKSRGATGSNPRGLWIVLAVVGLLLATGWPLILLKYVPGFSFFMGPGRYGVLTAWSLAMLAAAGWDHLQQVWGNSSRSRSMWWGLMVLTAGDLWAASREYHFEESPYFGRQVFYAALLDEVPIDFRDQSTVGTTLANFPHGARLYAPGANMPSLLGVPSLPVYLGLGPQPYFSPELQINFSTAPPAEREAIADRLRSWGVTHLLLQERLDVSIWPVEYLAPVLDPVLNRAMGRSEPFYMYQLLDSPGRVQWSGSGTIEQLESLPNRVTVTLTAASAGTLTLTDLNYPGWRVTVDRSPAEALPHPLYRVVQLPAGRHVIVWDYQPAWWNWGGSISLLCSVLIVVGAGWAFMRRRACRIN